MEKSRYTKIIEGEKVRRDFQLNTSSPQGLEVPFGSQRQLKSPRMQRFLEEGRMEGKDLVLLSVEEERIGKHKY